MLQTVRCLLHIHNDSHTVIRNTPFLCRSRLSAIITDATHTPLSIPRSSKSSVPSVVPNPRCSLISLHGIRMKKWISTYPKIKHSDYIPPCPPRTLLQHHLTRSHEPPPEAGARNTKLLDPRIEVSRPYPHHIRVIRVGPLYRHRSEERRVGKECW